MVASINNAAIAAASATLTGAFEDLGTELAMELGNKANTSSLKSGATTSITVSSAAPSGGNNNDVWIQPGT